MRDHAENATAAPVAPLADAPWHQRTAADALAALQSSAQGLSSASAAERRRRYGPNLLRETPQRPALKVMATQFADLTILVLIAAAVLSGVIGEPSDTVVILAVVVLNAALGTIQELRAERAMAALKMMAAPSTTVLRDGTAQQLPAAELVPGDVVILEAGGIAPADLRLLEAIGLRLDESALTGESVPVDKVVAPIPGDLPPADRLNMAYKGTTITAGRGVGLVVASGMRTELGRIAELLSEHQRVKTPLQRRLESLGRQIGLWVLAICVLVFVTGILRGEPALPVFLTALSLAVAAIPEALPAVVSIALALGARGMAAGRALVRRLPAVETLGAVTYICSDKTGTLTTNQMRVEAFYCDATAREALGAGPPWTQLREAMAISHDAFVDATGTAHGDPTEIALLIAAGAAGVTRAAAEQTYPRVAELPFDAERKRMTTLHRGPDGQYLSITKGAAEVLIELCRSERRQGATVPVNRDALLANAEQMANDGLRVLAFATRRWTHLPAVAAEVLESELEFLALVGLLDPPRPQARESVATCRAAGIVPVMITGDHPGTARAIARRIGLLRTDEELMSGAELATLSEHELARRVRTVRAYARVVPEQKVRIVTALQKNGEIVAMTGDGVNDAPALQRADIGVAMGITGTDVAKEASDMVLLDDNFATIVAAVHAGRRIYDNLRKFVRYILTTNAGEVWTIFLAPFVGLPVPLLPIQILWINLITDSLPGIALVSEPAEPDLMRRPPRPPTESLFAGGLGMHVFVFGLLMAAVILAAQTWQLHTGSNAWRTVAFTALCFTQIGHVLAIRSERVAFWSLGPLGNVPLLIAVAIALTLQLLVVYLPALQPLFGTAPLDAAQLGLCVGCGGAIFIAVEFEKAVRRNLATRAATHGRASEH